MASNSRSFEVGNTASTTHGGESAIKALQHGEPFKPGSPAARAEVAAREQLEAEGRGEMVRTLTVRMLAACDLFWGAVCTEAEKGDMASLDRYISRFGWLATSAARLLAELRKEEAGQPPGVLLDALRAAREAREVQRED